MGYEKLDILRGYKTNKHDIVREFYVPILKESVLYKRAVGFFSSTALIELSKGISGLIEMVVKLDLLFRRCCQMKTFKLFNRAIMSVKS